MNPRLFIGSSTESLPIAYAIQENLDHDATVTVWTQGIFGLSSNTLDDLITALDNFDFGIFVFQPDDVLKMRSSEKQTVRDNVIFEFGLFVGKLGKKRVFIVLPDNANDFHLPTDLLGLTYGRYNNLREDKNIKAALGAFCNKVRDNLKSFTYENLLDLANENQTVKDIAIKKPLAWEFLLAAALLKSRMININRSYDELAKGLVFQPSKIYDLNSFSQWSRQTSENIIRLVSILMIIFNKEIIKAVGEPGVAGNVIEIKSCIDKIDSVCKELLKWEYELQGIIAPNEVKEIPELMKGWTKIIIDEINKLPNLIEQSFTKENIDKSEPINITITFNPPTNIDKVMEIIDKVTNSLPYLH